MATWSARRTVVIRTGRSPSIGAALDPKRNSLNFIRLCLAVVVLSVHAFVLGGFGQEPLLNHTSMADVAVYAFLGLSGYLVTGSALRNTPLRFLWLRFIRIFPGFWACLLVTALVLGPIIWVLGHHPQCTLGCYLSAKPGPVSYVYRNALLKINQIYVIPPAVAQSIIGQITNGSLWTLYFEFLSYLTLLAVSLVGLLRHRIGVVVVFAATWSFVIAIAFVPYLYNHFNLFFNPLWMDYFKLVNVFFCGAVLYVFRDRVPDSGWLALACTAVFTASLWLPGQYPTLEITKSDLLFPLVVYPLMWLGAHLPFQRIGSRNDYSYGVYIYAFPVTVLLTTVGVQRWGYLALWILVLGGTAPLAAGSWWLLEKRVLHLKHLTCGDVRRWIRRSDASSTSEAA